MNWLLLVVVAIIVVNAWIGMKKGLIKVVFSMVSLLLAMVLTVVISPIVTDALMESETVYTSVYDRVGQMLDSNEEEVDYSDEDSFVENLKLPASIKKTLIDNRDKGISNFKGYVTESLSAIVLKAAGFVLTFIVLLVLIWLLSRVLNLISKLPVLNQINKSAGLIAGVLHGFIVVWILLTLITVFGGTAFGQSAFSMIEESRLLSLIYDYNFLTKYVVSAAGLIVKQ